MKAFTLTLGNGATLTGLTNLPDALPTDPEFKPLMVGLHGGSYTSAYFDVDEKHTAALVSNSLGVPWVAVDRPGYGGSTSFYRIPEGSSYTETLGQWLHHEILPAVWRQFGEPQGCNSVVLLCHSLGVPGGVIAAAELSQQEAETGQPAAYPLAGIIMSGFGTQTIGNSSSGDNGNSNDKDSHRDAKEQASKSAADEQKEEEELIHFSPEVKDAMLLPQGTCDASIYTHTARLNAPLPARERDDALATSSRFHDYWAPRVRVPILVGMAERDRFWRGDEAHVRDLVAAFTASPKVEGSLIRGAPHNLEMSYWAHSWYTRCFGFGLECAVWFAKAN
ncbi:hypothetical protein VTI28DRAFT_3437 [Corynascus sepedonium]